jgi:hypothetical protein
MEPPNLRSCWTNANANATMKEGIQRSSIDATDPKLSHLPSLDLIRCADGTDTGWNLTIAESVRACEKGVLQR